MSTSTTVRNTTPSRSRDQTKESSLSALRNFSELAGRVLLSILFLISGLGKVGTYSVTAGYMASLGVPGALLPLVIATDVLGAVAIILGWKTRLTAFLLAGFTLLSALIFHNNFADETQSIMFLKNVSIAGGFLVLVANGAGALSLDRRASKN